MSSSRFETHLPGNIVRSVAMSVDRRSDPWPGRSGYWCHPIMMPVGPGDPGSHLERHGRAR